MTALSEYIDECSIRVSQSCTFGHWIIQDPFTKGKPLETPLVRLCRLLEMKSLIEKTAHPCEPRDEVCFLSQQYIAM